MANIKTALSYVGMFSIAAQIVGGHSDVLAISELARAIVTYWRATTTKFAQALLDLLPIQLPEGAAFVLLTTIFMSMTVIGAERSSPRSSVQPFLAKHSPNTPSSKWRTVLYASYVLFVAGALGYASYKYGTAFLLFIPTMIISNSILWLRTKNHDLIEQYFRVLALYLILCVTLFQSNEATQSIWVFYITSAILLPFATPRSLMKRFLGILKLTTVILLASRVGVVIPQMQAAAITFAST